MPKSDTREQVLERFQEHMADTQRKYAQAVGDAMRELEEDVRGLYKQLIVELEAIDVKSPLER